MTYRHKVKMIYNCRFVTSSVELLHCEPCDARPVSEAESKNAYAPLYFLHLAFEWTAAAWVCATSSKAFLFPFTNRSISHSKLRPLAVYGFIYFLFLLMTRAPPGNTRAPPLAGTPHTLRTTGLDTALNENHFTSDCLTNEGHFKAGFSQRLILKEGTIPTLRAWTSAPDKVNITRFFSKLPFLKNLLALCKANVAKAMPVFTDAAIMFYQNHRK